VNMGQNPEWIVGLQSLGCDAAVKICIAAVLGAIIGLERVWKGHPAGLRTNLLIAISSCVFTIVSIEGFPLQGAAQDTARVAAQIVTGVGFLGAGAVLRSKGHVRGLTTAASIWLVAALGMAVGTGLFFLAIFTTLLSIGLLILLRPLSRRLELQAVEQVEEDDD
jgi:putative Mg2+ transporter-C (MgtC) family protein